MLPLSRRTADFTDGSAVIHGLLGDIGNALQQGAGLLCGTDGMEVI